MAGTLCLVFGCSLSTLHGTWHSADTNKRQLNQGKISLPIEEGANRQPRHRGTEERELLGAGSAWAVEGGRERRGEDHGSPGFQARCAQAPRELLHTTATWPGGALSLRLREKGWRGAAQLRSREAEAELRCSH